MKKRLPLIILAAALLLLTGCDEILNARFDDLPEEPPQMTIHAEGGATLAERLSWQWEITGGAKKGFRSHDAENPLNPDLALPVVALTPGETLGITLSEAPSPIINVRFYANGEGDGLVLVHEFPTPDGDAEQSADSSMDAFATFAVPEEPDGIYVIEGSWPSWHKNGVTGEAVWAFSGRVADENGGES